MTECEPRIRVQPKAFVIRAAVRERKRHPVHDRIIDPTAAKDSGYSAHRQMLVDLGLAGK
jgi:hypothetical protein